MMTIHNEKDWGKRYDQIYSWSTQWEEMCSIEEVQGLQAEFGPTDLLDTISRARLTIKKRKSTQTNSMASSISTSSMVHTDTDSTKACEPPLETPVLTPPGVRFAPVPPPTPEQEGENLLHANTERVPNLPPTSIPKKAGNALQTCQEETEENAISTENDSTQGSDSQRPPTNMKKRPSGLQQAMIRHAYGAFSRRLTTTSKDTPTPTDL